MITPTDTGLALSVELLQLTNSLGAQSENLARGDVCMQRAALEATKYVFDTCKASFLNFMTESNKIQLCTQKAYHILTYHSFCLPS